MLLSIAMIVKNEEKNIERCLKALKELDNKIEYEIIVIDTGSEDNTIKIAKKYTDKVYACKWCDDFAAMRNESIKYCKGEWILILDADEVLRGSDSLTEFLLNKNNTKYNYAAIKFRNIMSKDENDFVSAELIRLFKNHKEFKYVGKVHEQPTLIGEGTYTNITVNHYGYNLDTYEAKKRKFDRNIKLLFDDLNNNKNMKYTYYQIAKTYLFISDDEKALEYIEKAMALVQCDKRNNEYMYVYHEYCLILLKLSQYSKVIQVAEDALKYNDKIIDFYYFLFKAHWCINNCDKADKYYKEYMDLYEKMNQGFISNDVSVESISLSRKNEVVANKITIDYKNYNYKAIVNEYQMITNDEYKKIVNSFYIKSLLRLHMYDKLHDELKGKVISDNDIENFSLYIDGEMNGYNSNFILDENIAKSIGKIDPKINTYIKVKNKNENVKIDDINYSGYFHWKCELLIYAIVNNNCGLDTLEQLEDKDIRKYTAGLSNNEMCLNKMLEFIKNNIMTTNIRRLNLLINIQEVLLLCGAIDIDEYSILVVNTCINRMNYVKLIYRDEIINSVDKNAVLASDNMIWLDFVEYIKEYSNDKMNFILKLKMLLEKYPQYHMVIKNVMMGINYVGITMEMVEEKERLLLLVEQYLCENRILESVEILDELNHIFKYDFKILSYLGVSYYMKGDYYNALMNLGIANLIENNNFNTVYNIACVLEKDRRFSDAINYYKKAEAVCADYNTQMNIRNIIEGLKAKIGEI